MKLIVRVVTGLTLLMMSISSALHGAPWVRVLASIEIFSAAAFCLPRVWRIGGYVLLGVLAIALVRHGMAGHFAAHLFFAALVIVLELTK